MASDAWAKLLKVLKRPAPPVLKGQMTLPGMDDCVNVDTKEEGSGG